MRVHGLAAPGGPAVNVLVTGAGGPLGVSIIKALRQSALSPRIVSTDSEARSVGLYRVDAGYVLPHVACDPDAYISALQETIARERVGLVCFGSEVEMAAIAPVRDDIEAATGARLVVERPGVLATITDKWGMVALLHRHGLPVPETVLASDQAGIDRLVREHGFPLIIKPRRGSGSKRVIRAENQRELDALCGYLDDAVVQEYLGPDDEEYTVGLYTSRRNGYVGQISLRRSLVSGNTYKAEVVDDPEIEQLARAFSGRIGAWGPANLQLRRTSSGPRVFEVNLRFSASTVMRAWFGFNLPELAIRDLVLGEELARPCVRPGFAFRYWEEVYLTPEQLADGPPRASAEPVGERPELF